jgi:polyisoprenoid-binding protein YceI
MLKYSGAGANSPPVVCYPPTVDGHECHGRKSTYRRAACSASYAIVQEENMRTKTILATLTAVVAVLAGGASADNQYTFDKAHSSIEFAVKHMVISNVKGTFDDFDGVIKYDPDNIENSSVEVSIKVASVNTKNQKRDDHLRSADFFDVEQHPEITFKSSKIKKTGDGFAAVGTLTIRGVSKEVELPFALNGPITNPWGKSVVGIEIDYELNRHHYGVKWNQTLDSGGVVVGDDVKIEINLEAIKS